MTRRQLEKNTDYNHWSAPNLRDSKTGLLIYDIDFIHKDWKNKKIMVVELKQFQKKPFKYINQIHPEWPHYFEHVMDEMNEMITMYYVNVKGYEYLGYNIISFSNTTPDNSDHIWWNEEEISREEFIKRANIW